MPRLVALQAEWCANPPAHWLIAAMVKYRPPQTDNGERPETTIAAIQAAFLNGRL